MVSLAFKLLSANLIKWSNKLYFIVAPQACNFIKKRQYRRFSVKFTKFLRTCIF